MRFESHYHFLLLDKGAPTSYAIKTPSFKVEEGGCRQRPPSILGLGGSCSSTVVLTTSLIWGLRLNVLIIIIIIIIIYFILLFFLFFFLFWGAGGGGQFEHESVLKLPVTCFGDII